MLIYLRKITNNDTKKQIETTVEAYELFFGGDISNSTGVTVNIRNAMGNCSDFRISKAAGSANSYRFSSNPGDPTLARFIETSSNGTFAAQDILKIEKRNSIYHLSLIERSDPNYSVFDAMLVSRENTILVSDDVVQNESTSDFDGKNILIYGVPGCGKSHYIKKNYTLTDENSERVVFHPDYTYSDFVGQILPQIDDTTNTIDYKFIAGPFTRLLKKCEEDKDAMHYLVIEEINRGNAPAIFGEIFQLLDRNSSGVSEYGISNTDIAKKVYDDENQKVKIPSNLTILATMNTADQNVFTLDTAFKRRWEMLSIRNNFKLKDGIDEEDIKFNAQLNYKLCDSSIDWKTFAVAINKVIIEESESNLGSEDKRLGHFFIKQSEMADVNKFSEKVIMYLWNDVFKFEKSKVFNSQYTTLEDVLDAFAGKERFNVFDEKLGFKNSTQSGIISQPTDSDINNDTNDTTEELIDDSQEGMPVGDANEE